MLTPIKRLYLLTTICSVFSTFVMFYTYFSLEDYLTNMVNLQLTIHQKVLDIEDYMVPREARVSASDLEGEENLDN